MMYPVNDIYPCIQGEGCNTGIPMVMIRLQGCEVGCPWCDTKETWGFDEVGKDGVSTGKSAFVEVPMLPMALGKNAKYARVDALSIALYARGLAPQVKWALISGGEPAKYELSELIDILHVENFSVALETSGTEEGHFSGPYFTRCDWVTVSPKFDMPGGKKLIPEVCRHANEIKMPVGKQADIDRLLGLYEDGYIADAVVCLAPLSQSKAATELCVQTCLKYGWRLSCQLHKYLELP